MNDRIPDTVFLIAALTLPLAALFARRLPIASVLKMVLAWTAIFAVGLVIVGQRERIGTMFDGAKRTVIGDDQSVVGDTVRIAMAADGHFWATATINGVRRRMLVDSGATVTALASGTAAAAGIKPDAAFPVMIGTANGDVLAERATVRVLKLGSVEARDLPVVVSEAFGDVDVLGMNFLSRLGSWRVEGRSLVLEPRKRT